MTTISKKRSGKQNSAPASQPEKRPNELRIEAATEEEANKKITRGVLSPDLASAMVSKSHWEKVTGRELDYGTMLDVLREASDKIAKGDLGDVEAMLYSQAASLNGMFAHLNALAVNNLLASGKFEFGRQLMVMALKAQNQSRMTLETLGNIKNGPMVYAKQANINNGGQQQVNNGTASRAPATEKENPPNKVLEQGNEQRMDTGTQSKTSAGNSAVEAVAASNGTDNT